ncbi:MAG TPA: cyanophycin synthetase [Candidatus Paceibacterota bacterium]|jgi:UDP-N-acetylmuramoylalanine--D-glutamate ligase|nr:cyanophycin synthetase [Candidatus Paceibacterota bacterium]
MNTRTYFQGKRIAVIGLGPHGEMVDDVKFLIKADALVSVYDLRSEARLKNHIVFLRSVGLANYVCSSIPADDLLDMDLIILSHEYPRDSSFLKAAREKGIQIEYPETLFFRLAPPVTVVGVIGSCGKTTVTSLLAPLLEAACDADGTQSMFTLDPESGDGILVALKKIKSGDIALIRIIEQMMPEFYEMRVSPHVAIFTTVPPKGSYSTSPFEILTYQTYNNFIIASDEVIDAIHTFKFQPKAKMLRTKPSIIPASWVFGADLNGGSLWNHDKDNASLALQAAQLFKVPDEVSETIMEKWKPLKGRLELVKKIKNIEFYNDTASISPESTIVGMRSIAKDRNIVLILGGADRDCDYTELYRLLPECAHTVILLPGSGTMKERKLLNALDTIKIISAPDIAEAVRLARDNARQGDKILFSPGFAACGIEASRKERGEVFVRAVRGL